MDQRIGLLCYDVRHAAWRRRTWCTAKGEGGDPFLAADMEQCSRATWRHLDRMNYSSRRIRGILWQLLRSCAIFTRITLPQRTGGRYIETHYYDNNTKGQAQVRAVAGIDESNDEQMMILTAERKQVWVGRELTSCWVTWEGRSSYCPPPWFTAFKKDGRGNFTARHPTRFPDERREKQTRWRPQVKDQEQRREFVMLSLQYSLRVDSRAEVSSSSITTNRVVISSTVPAMSHK
jgi:hypothetical protein